MATAKRTAAKRGEGRGRPGGEPRAPAARRWPVQEARARLSRLIDDALAGRPQRISRRGQDVAVLISAAEYERLARPRETLLEFFQRSPLAEAMAEGEPDLERDRSPLRDLCL